MKYEAFIVHMEVTTLVALADGVEQHVLRLRLGGVEGIELMNLVNEVRARLQHIQAGYAPSGDFDPAGVDALFTPDALKLSEEVRTAALSHLIHRQQPLEDWLA